MFKLILIEVKKRRRIYVKKLWKQKQSAIMKKCEKRQLRIIRVKDCNLSSRKKQRGVLIFKETTFIQSNFYTCKA